jgi:type II restriction enzyme
MITGNKGEWSEIYTLFKLLGDTVMYPGNEKIEKISNIIYPIIKILRSESNGDYEYSIKDNIVIISGNEEILKIPISLFKEKAIILLETIKTNSSGTFAIPEIQGFMESINCISLKAKSSEKTDIRIVIHDERTNQKPLLGFSIKSQLGSPSTLLNAGKTTNFIFKIENVELTLKDILHINNIDSRSKIKDRIQAIYDRGGKFEFVKADKQIFTNNLILIDSLLPQIISEIVFGFYTTGNSTMIDLLSVIETKNPLNFDTSNHHQFYTYKLKRFLTDIALGMMPSKVWTGEYDATGGYLIVKADGDVLCYHIYNRNVFENYLISNTKLETASSSRHGFGEIYKEEEALFFKLNLQIRFIK